MKTLSYLLVCAVLIGLAGCSEDDAVVDQGLPETQSVLTNLELSGYSFDTDTLNVPTSGEKHDDDPITIPITYSVLAVPSAGASVSEVRITVTPQGSSTPVVDVVVPNSGGNMFTGTFDMNIVRNNADDYNVRVTGTDSRGAALAPAITKIEILNGKYPPVMSEFNGPDSLKLPETGSTSFYFTVKVTDRSGQNDIRFVFYRRTSGPDGPAPAGNNISLTDDGRNGDAVAADSIYTAGARIESTNLRGEYVFEFQATDRSNLSATPIQHKIIVY